MRIVAVVMAGGRGERFWPKSTTAMPKQFLVLWGNRTLLQQAFDRATRVTDSVRDVYVTTGQDYRALVLSQLPEIPPENVIVEPASRDTAPAIGYAAVCIARRLPDAVMVVLPSDHVVLDEEKFAETLRHAALIAESGDYLVTVGMRPTRPEEGYGYIELGEPIPDAQSSSPRVPSGLCDERPVVNALRPAVNVFCEPHGCGQGYCAFKVKRFTEKPDLNQALDFVRCGRHLWNAGMFAWRISALRNALKEHAPSLEKGLSAIEAILREAHTISTETIESAIRARFLQLERKSIDYALLEKADNIVVVPADFGWDDVGTWAALERIFDKDENGNVIKGEALAIEAAGNIIDNSTGDKLFVAFGVKNLVIVNSDDVVLVADKRRSGNLKKLREALKGCGKEHTSVQREAFEGPTGQAGEGAVS